MSITPLSQYPKSNADSNFTQRIRTIAHKYDQVMEHLGKAILCQKEIGDELRAIKKEINHGGWMGWYTANRHRFRFSLRTAEKYMKLSENWSKIEERVSQPQMLTMRQALNILDEPDEDEKPSKSDPIFDHSQCCATLRELFVSTLKTWPKETVVFLATHGATDLGNCLLVRRLLNVEKEVTPLARVFVPALKRFRLRNEEIKSQHLSVDQELARLADAEDRLARDVYRAFKRTPELTKYQARLVLRTLERSEKYKPKIAALRQKWQIPASTAAATESPPKRSDEEEKRRKHWLHSRRRRQ